MLLETRRVDHRLHQVGHVAKLAHRHISDRFFPKRIKQVLSRYQLETVRTLAIDELAQRRALKSGRKLRFLPANLKADPLQQRVDLVHIVRIKRLVFRLLSVAREHLQCGGIVVASVARRAHEQCVDDLLLLRDERRAIVALEQQPLNFFPGRTFRAQETSFRLGSRDRHA